MHIAVCRVILYKRVFYCNRNNKIMVNLVKFIASSGAASRRQAETLIRGGRVTVNGAVVDNPAHRVSGTENICLDGRKVSAAEKLWYILLNKPRSYTCSSADKHAEKLAVDLLETVPARLVSAGRLDKDSEGAIIFSNDGDFINTLTHPRYGVLKRYIVHTAGKISENDLRRMEKGIRDAGEVLKAERVRQISEKCYEFVLNEGKKREIRRLTAACGAPTQRLIRVQIGEVELGSLAPGEFRELSPVEIAAFREYEK